jgi:parallel beta-helix repeat protein
VRRSDRGVGAAVPRGIVVGVAAVALALAATVVIAVVFGPSPSGGPSPPPSGSPSTTPAPTTCEGVNVPSGASLATAIANAPSGATLCLTGSYTVGTPLHPKDDQTFIGPAKIVGSGDTGFELKVGGSENVTLERLEMSGFALRAVECADGFVGRDLDLYDNDRNGLGCGLEGGSILLEDSFIHDNGSVAELGAGGGGVKVVRCGECVIRDNRIIHNVGNGLWCDLACSTFTVTGNTVDGNTRKGIFFEVSLGPAVITHNTVTRNNCVPSIWGNACEPQSAGAPGGGIVTNSSCPDLGEGVTCLIADNTLGGNMVAGINFRDDGRPEGGTPAENGLGCCVGTDAPFDISVEDNDLNGDHVLHCGTMGVVCSRNS